MFHVTLRFLKPHSWSAFALLCSALLITACVAVPASDANQTLPPSADQTVSPTDEPTAEAADDMDDSTSNLSADEQQLVERAQEVVATETGAATAELSLVAIEAMEWRDGGLGCPEPGAMYMQAITPGYQITLADGSGTTYDVRTESAPTGTVRLCTQPEAAADASAASPTSELVGTVWQWQTDQLQDTANYTIEFLPDDAIAVQADCNRGRASYTTFGTNGLQINPPALTRAACPPGSLDSIFIEQFVASSSYAFDGENLVLYPVVNPGIMNFVPASDAEMEGESPALSGVITGTVTYRQRIALPADSVIDVSLQDVSRADAPAEILASQTITTTGENVPIPFELTYDPAQVDPRFTYALRARITMDGELRWTSTEAYLVLTNGQPASGVDVVVSPTQ